MLYVLKLGLDLYNGNTDRNGGNHEFNLILAELKFIYKELKLVTVQEASKLNFSKNDILVVISGAEQPEMLAGLKRNIERTNVKSIFITTDYRVIDRFPLIKEIEFDLALTQSLVKIEGLKAKKQAYSYVPELFLTNDNKYSIDNFNKRQTAIIFGGNIDGRINKYKMYLGNSPIKKCLYQSSKIEGIENRVSYGTFQESMRCFKYTIVFSDIEYENNFFVTPRLIEALNNCTIPFVDADYDKKEHFISKDSFLIVRSGEELIEKIIALESSQDTLSQTLKELNEMKKDFKVRRNNFCCKPFEYFK